jgi:hypothetical protein
MKMRKTISTIGLGAVAAMLMQVQTAQATFTTTDTLADLTSSTGTYNGLAVGDKEITGFSYVASSFLVGFDANDIQVTLTETAPNSYILTWGGSIGTVSAGVTLADLLLNYTVTATDGSIFAIDQSYTGTGTIPGGSLDIKENVYAHGTAAPILASSELTYAVTSTSYSAAGAILNPSQTSVDVTKDIALSTLQGGTISISQIEQSFEEVAVPEPTTVVAGILLLLPLGASTVKILRNRKALV